MHIVIVRYAAILTFVLVFLSGVVSASEDGSTEMAWSELNDQQKAILKPFKSTWSAYGLDRRDRLRRAANRWLVMAPEKREFAKQRFSKLFQMESDDSTTETFRQRLENYESLTDDERSTVQKEFLNYQSIPQKQRKALVDKWRSLSEEEKKRFRNRATFKLDSEP